MPAERDVSSLKRRRDWVRSPPPSDIHSLAPCKRIDLFVRHKPTNKLMHFRSLELYHYGCQPGLTAVSEMLANLKHINMLDICYHFVYTCFINIYLFFYLYIHIFFFFLTGARRCNISCENKFLCHAWPILRNLLGISI